MSPFPYAFEAEVAYYAFERYAYTVVYLPPEIAAAEPFASQARVRIEGEVADFPIAGAWQPAGEGRRFLILSRRFLKAAGLRVGASAQVRFRIADQNAVALPEALAEALDADSAFAAQWGALTPGAQRAFAHRVGAAKTEATIAKRLSEVRAMIAAGQRPGARPDARRAASVSRRGRAASTD